MGISMYLLSSEMQRVRLYDDVLRGAEMKYIAGGSNRRSGPLSAKLRVVFKSDSSMMAQAQAQALRIEIQYLKGALAASQTKSDQYAQLGAFCHRRLANRTNSSPK